jgi:hypothetical protein
MIDNSLECIICRGAAGDLDLERIQIWEDDLWRLTASLVAERFISKDFPPLPEEMQREGYLSVSSWFSRTLRAEVRNRHEAREAEASQTWRGHTFGA